MPTPKLLVHSDGTIMGETPVKHHILCGLSLLVRFLCLFVLGALIGASLFAMLQTVMFFMGFAMLQTVMFFMGLVPNSAVVGIGVAFWGFSLICLVVASAIWAFDHKCVVRQLTVDARQLPVAAVARSTGGCRPGEVEE